MKSDLLHQAVPFICLKKEKTNLKSPKLPVEYQAKNLPVLATARITAYNVYECIGRRTGGTGKTQSKLQQEKHKLKPHLQTRQQQTAAMTLQQVQRNNSIVASASKLDCRQSQ
ncbi:hypothetical protein LK494_08400 [Anaerovorax odorimutans]|nr:hypothetical protein [Anaerovorax odorimutans]